MIEKTNLNLDEITKDYYIFKKNNNKIIYGYNLLVKHSFYEKYNVVQEDIYNYDGEYYNNYGGIIIIIKYQKKLFNKLYKNIDVIKKNLYNNFLLV